jgi:hypothetical protein
MKLSKGMEFLISQVGLREEKLGVATVVTPSTPSSKVRVIEATGVSVIVIHLPKRR